MEPTELAHYERLLKALEKDLLAKATLRIEPNRTDDAAIGEDEDEQPLNEMLQSIASSRNRNTSLVLKRITRALRKARQAPEDFGLCEECEEDIEEGRLKAMPYAELCVDCQSKRDPRGGSKTRRNPFEFV
ncbi:MAG TPA: conjugal transfer protein TraR [Myxococcales bacterium]|nr:conjugal transfer protein TraR [Myxococcales bacterium]